MMTRTTKARQALLVEAGYAMQAYQRSTQAFDDAVGRALGVNPTALRALDWLVDGPKSAGQLSAGTGLSTAATTDLIDRLAQKGFVRRVADPADRRRISVEMTEEGASRVGSFYQPLVDDGTELLADVSDDQLAWMRDWLEAARRLTDRHRQRLEERSDPSL
jgi:DNA-binding MarR family transcriptional regulator